MRLARKRRHGRKGPLDFRSTVRHSLSTGGVPVDPKFRYPRPAKPEIVVIADISGSVASFARFTLHLVHAIASQFSKVRSFVFIDGIDEVTRFFEGVDDVAEAVHRINTEADVVWVDGHSDYGHAFTVFWERWGRRSPPARACSCSAMPGTTTTPRRPGWSRRSATGPATCTGSTPNPAPTGEPGTPSWASTPCTATTCSSAATCASSSGSCRSWRERHRPASRIRRIGPPARVRTVRPPSGEGTRLVLIRHGEAACNVGGVVGGRTGCTGLTPLGRRQALALAARLVDTGELSGAVALYTSVLPRAVETADLAGPGLGGGPPRQDCDLCELHPGEADGLTWDEFRDRFGEPDFDADPEALVAPGGESWSSFVARASGALRRLAAAHRGGQVVVVCHAGVIEASMLAFLPVAPDRGRLGLPTEHTSLTEWSIDAGGGPWRLVRYNDAAHLRVRVL